MKTNQTNSKITKPILIALAAWLALIFYLGADGFFTRSPGTPPIPILLGFALPIAVFLVLFRFSKTFHEFVMSFDLRLAAAIQAWRFAGMGFIALYANGVLPGIFAWPAGLGDMAVGLTAPWITLALIRNPAFATGRQFALWNLGGILDLIVAVTIGGLSILFSHGLPGEITTRPMSQLPLLLIPVYLVPILLMLHLTALFQARCRQGARETKDLNWKPDKMHSHLAA